MKLRVRAEESLKKSQLPPRMAARGSCVLLLSMPRHHHLTDAEVSDISRRKAFLDEMERSAALTDRPRFQPHIHHAIPDFKQLQLDFETTLTLKKQSRPVTTPHPFSITDSKAKADAASRIAKVVVVLTLHCVVFSHCKTTQDIEHDEATLRETRWPFTAPRTAPKARPYGPLGQSIVSVSKAAAEPTTALTRSVELRHATIRKALQQRESDQQIEAQLKTQRLERDQQLARAIAAKSSSNDHSARLQASTELKVQKRKVRFVPQTAVITSLLLLTNDLLYGRRSWP